MLLAKINDCTEPSGTIMNKKQTRRDFLKKAAYTAPAVMTLSAMPSFAGAGSRRPCNNGNGNGAEGCSPGQGWGANNDED